MKNQYLREMEIPNPMVLISSGTVQYTEYKSREPERFGPIERKITLELGRDFGNYYQSLIPKCIKTVKQSYPTHITIVRGGIEPIINMEAWGKYKDKEISFYYMPMFRYYKNVYVLDAFSQELNDIRVELGLAPYRKGYRRFHITIANDKFLREDKKQNLP